MTSKLAARCQQRDYSPVSWTDYFHAALDIPLEADDKQVHSNIHNDYPLGGAGKPLGHASFRVYTRNFRPPYAPDRLPNQEVEMTEAEFNEYNQYPTLVTLHGGGYSGLTWAQFTHHIEQECHCRVMAIDLRSHGDTKTRDDEQMDIDTLVDDVIKVTHQAHRICGFLETPKIILVGHSMGGAIAVKCSARCADLMPSLAGFVIIDVVEGTAKDALPLMMTVIKTRPTRFPSIENAIEWSVRSGMAKNSDAARVSMPGSLLNIASQHLAIHDIECSTNALRQSNFTKHKFHINIENLMTHKSHTMKALPLGLPLSPRVAALKAAVGGRQPIVPPTATAHSSVIDEADESSGSSANSETEKTRHEDQIDSDGYKKPPGLDESGYCWRTDLAKTQPYWPGWFEGLSAQMLSAPVQGKFLLLAGIDRLDKTLTIGQMQGKFMMKVLPKCGHAVHEDSPERVASEIGQFLVRNKFTTAVVEKK